VNTWLALACFGVKLPHELHTGVANELMRIFSEERQWKKEDLYASDLSNLCVSIASLEVK